MDITTIVSLVKERLGIRSTVRDNYLTQIATGVVEELEDEKGITLTSGNFNHLLFCVDYTTWRYESVGKDGAMPRHLQFRLHNLIIHNGGGSSDI
jgi:hypothetical protein